MNIEIGGLAKALDEGDGVGVGLGAFYSCLFDQKCRNDPVDDLQHGCEQMGMGGKEVTQRDRK